jgi:hypothetical protein
MLISPLIAQTYVQGYLLIATPRYFRDREGNMPGFSACWRCRGNIAVLIEAVIENRGSVTTLWSSNQYEGSIIPTNRITPEDARMIV